MAMFLLFSFLIFSTLSKNIAWPFPVSYGAGLIQVIPWENIDNVLFLVMEYNYSFTSMVAEVSFTPEPKLVWSLNVTNIFMNSNYR